MFVRYSIQGGHRVIAAHPVQSPVLITAGCSFRFGLGLDDQDTRPWHLQDYHVINTDGTDQALMAAARAALESKDPYGWWFFRSEVFISNATAARRGGRRHPGSRGLVNWVPSHDGAGVRKVWADA